MISATLVVLVYTLASRTGSSIIPIGAIFDRRSEVTHRAFEHALVQHHKRTNRVNHTFNLTLDLIDVADDFQLTRAICRQMSQGVFAIFGQKSTKSAAIVRSLTSTFHMPFITPSLALSSVGDSRYELHLRPDHTAAMVDLIHHFRWSNIHFLYDSDEGLHRLQQIHRMMRNASVQWFSVVRLQNTADVIDDLRLADGSDPEYSTLKVFVLDLSSDEAYNQVLRQIPEVGMNKFGYNYLLGTLDFHSLDVSKFRYGGASISGFQLLSNFPVDTGQEASYEWTESSGAERQQINSHGYGLPVEAALAVDGLHVLDDAISGMQQQDRDVFRWIFRRGLLYNWNNTRGVPCTTKPPAPWMFGPRLFQALTKSETNGLSGSVTFNPEGYRTNVNLGVYSVTLDVGIQKIGTWSSQWGFSGVRSPPANQGAPLSVGPDVNSSLIITSILTKPFLMEKETKDGEPALIGNNKYEGFSMDLANELAALVGFEFQFKIVADGNYGQRLADNNTWDGLVGELMSGAADLCVAPLTITSERERYVDFSKHFMDLGVTIMIKKPASQRPGVFSFMEPLSVQVWMCIVLAYITVSLSLCVVSRLSPVAWSKVHQGRQSYRHDYSLVNSFWFAMGALMFQGSDNCPRSVSGRIIGGAWWFFVLISISSYTANLAAFLTVERMVPPIESADDLLNHPTIKYGAVLSGSTLQFFINSDVPVYRQMGEYMTAHPEVLVQTNEEGVEKVLQSKGRYAFLAESPLVDFVNNRKPCDTTSVGGLLSNKGFGVATPRHSRLRDPVNVAVLKLKEEGTLYTLYQKWWIEKGQCAAAQGNKKGKMSLSLSNVAGVFYILIIGLVLSILLGVAELSVFRARCKQVPSRRYDIQWQDGCGVQLA